MSARCRRPARDSLHGSERHDVTEERQKRAALYLFLDLETTGLDPDRDVVTQVAWIIGVDERNYHLAYDGFPTLWSAGNTTAWYYTEHATSSQLAFGHLSEDCLRASTRNHPHCAPCSVVTDNRRASVRSGAPATCVLPAGPCPGRSATRYREGQSSPGGAHRRARSQRLRENSVKRSHC